MALVFCDNCGHRVSTTAPRCPSCGVPGPAAQVGRQPSARSSEREANFCDVCAAKSFSTVARYCTKCGTPFAPRRTAGKRRLSIKRALGFVGITLAATAFILVVIRFRNFLTVPTTVFRPSPGAAVLLATGPHEGKVLIADNLLYDPAANALAILPSTDSVSAFGTTTVLMDGTVLIAGGLGKREVGTPNDTIAAVAASKLFNPLTSNFQPVGNMTDARLLHTATLLSDGRVLIAGGIAKAEFTRDHVNFAPLASSELYDYRSKTFGAGPLMTAARFDAIAVSLPTGKVLIAGGADSAGNAIASTEIYDPTTNAFERGPEMTVPRAWAAATELSDGRVAFIGGCARYLVGSRKECEGSLSSTECYDPRDNTFKQGPSMNRPLGGATALSLGSGKVLIVGGFDSTRNAADFSDYPNLPNVVSSTEVFDPRTATFVQGPTMTTQRTDAILMPLAGGKVLISNGDAAEFHDVTEIYDPDTNTLAAGPRAFYGEAVLLRNGEVMLLGSRLTALFDPRTNTFGIAPELNRRRIEPAVVSLANGKVLVAGGRRLMPSHAIASTELYNPATGTFIPGPNMNAARFWATAALLETGRVLIAGGATVDVPTSPIASTELYDPATNTFNTGPNMNTARFSATSTALRNGKVLIAGGDDSNGQVTGTTELYDPTTNTFSPGANMNTARVGATATLLNDGRVLFAGGYSEAGKGATTSTELYDPVTNTFVAGPTMDLWGPPGTLLENGKALFFSMNSDCELSAEFYDAATNMFNAGARLRVSVSRCSGGEAIRLSDGRVLIVGALFGTAFYDPVTDSFAAPWNTKLR